jgi:hypothetical protein
MVLLPMKVTGAIWLSEPPLEARLRSLSEPRSTALSMEFDCSTPTGCCSRSDIGC